MFDLIKARIYFRSLGDLLSTRKVVAHGAMNMKLARGIGILINVDDQAQYLAAMAFAQRLEANGKVVSLLGFCKNAKTKGEIKIPVFDKSTLNDSLFPRDNDVEKFINTRFDLLINLCTELIYPLDYVAALSYAVCRVGIYNKKHEHSYELMLNVDPSISTENFISNIEDFLNAIKIV